MTDTGPLKKDLVCVRGDSNEIEIGPIILTDQSGVQTPIDLTVGTWNAWFTVKHAADDPDADAVFQGTEATEITLNDPPTAAKNYMTVRIPDSVFPSEDPLFAAPRTTLVYDAEIKNTTRHNTVARGRLHVVADVGHA